MKLALRDFLLWVFLAIFGIGLLVFQLSPVKQNLMAQEKQDPPAKTEEPKLAKTWKLPDYMRENLQRELDDFNKKFNEKVDAYRKELKTRFAEFKDMPDDVILYLEGGFFITRSDFQKLQDQLRDKLKQEVKGDDKTTN